MDGGYRIEVVSRMPGAEVDRVAAQGRKGVVDQKNCEFYDQKTYLRQQRCYGVKSKTAVSCDGHRMNIHSYVFRSPSKEMTETDELLDRLEAFQKAWSRKKISVLSQADRKNLDFFVVHLGGPWNAALTFKKKSGRLPPRKKSSAHSKFQADSSY